MRIAICDDDKKICTQIENTLLEYAEKSMQNIDVLVFFLWRRFNRIYE